MIHINNNFKVNFQEKYFKVIYSSFLAENIENFFKSYPQLHNRFGRFLSDSNLKNILLTKPSDMHKVVTEFFSKVPELYEFTHANLYLRDVSIPGFDFKNFDFRVKLNQKSFDESLNKLKSNLRKIKVRSCIIRWALMKLNTLARNSESKLIYEQLMALVDGKRTYVIKDVFPDWVYDFIKIFDYSKLPKDLSYNVIAELGIGVCPYCNENNIYNSFSGQKSYRSELDHFFPKSKFPFLALSLYNLIPACNICNGPLKGNYDTFHNKAAYPYLIGVNDKPLFKVDIGDVGACGEKVTEDDISIKVLKLNNEIDLNITLFDIQQRYNHLDFKIWSRQYLELKDTLDSLNLQKEDVGGIDLSILFAGQCKSVSRNLGQNYSSLKTKHKKFSLDLYNQLFSPKLRLDD
ncbi:HNH endonuclease [Pseudoalteromonas mariniglutinosa]|uniref:HNH endonuclease n=1 Tax=Pseudoalteromonas mariniglutinosa TaxID=206042 RepID=UPI00384EEE1D